MRTPVPQSFRTKKGKKSYDELTFNRSLQNASTVLLCSLVPIECQNYVLVYSIIQIIVIIISINHSDNGRYACDSMFDRSVNTHLKIAKKKQRTLF